MADDDLDRWITDLCAALDLDPAAVDRDLLLDLARDAAHGVARPAAPLDDVAGRSCQPAATEATPRRSPRPPPSPTALANNRPS